MGDTIFIFNISPEDYEAFRGLLNSDLPNTYNEWLKLHKKWIEDHRADGDIIRDTKVYPDQFSRYLNRTGRAPNLKELLSFAESVAKGEAY